MQISILTLFPEMFRGPFDASIIKRAQEVHLVSIAYINIRDFATDRHKSVDDHPYGGGSGMILKVDVVDRAITAVKKRRTAGSVRTILLDPQGVTYKQSRARELSRVDHLILVCAHYEGIDERIRTLVDEEISIGDYVVTGGELPAMIVADSVVRLLPGVLKKEDATTNESFTEALLEYPQYTRPPDYQGRKVPVALLSGNHKKIETWRKLQAIKRTRERRPDMR